MPLAVTLCLDDETAVGVERMWRALEEQTGDDDDALRLGYPPHLTLAIIPDAPVTAHIEKAVFDLVDNWDALPLTLAGFGVFPTSSPVIWLAPVVTKLLLACNETLCAALVPNPIDPHYCPGAWVPHVTLSQGTRSVARAVEVASSVWRGPIRGWADRIDLVRFHLVKILCSKALRITGGVADVTKAFGITPGVQNS